MKNTIIRLFLFIHPSKKKSIRINPTLRIHFKSLLQVIVMDIFYFPLKKKFPVNMYDVVRKNVFNNKVFSAKERKRGLRPKVLRLILLKVLALI